MSRRCHLGEALTLLLLLAATIATAERLVVLEETRVEKFLTGVETTPGRSGSDTVVVNLPQFTLEGSLYPWTDRLSFRLHFTLTLTPTLALTPPPLRINPSVPPWTRERGEGCNRISKC